MDDPQDLERADVEATVAARRELGPDYEAALVDAFAERVERAIEVRVHARMAAVEQEQHLEKERQRRQFTLGMVSLGFGIPLTAISGGIADVTGIALTWAGIAAVNLSFAWQNRGRAGSPRRE